jgi:hypothetical protein
MTASAARALRRLATLVRGLFGDVPNVEWLRAQLSRAVVLDRARAQAAIGETERCLRLRAAGGYCGRFATPPS